MNMTAKACHELINLHYAKPTFVEWKPFAWQMEYYKGKVGQRRLLKTKIKEDAKLKIEFEKKLAIYNNVHAIIDEIDTYPSEIASLFLSTFKFTIDDLIRRHEAYLNHRNCMIETYGEDIVQKINSLKYLVYKNCWESTWSGRHRTVEVEVDIDDETWKKFTETYEHRCFKDVVDYHKLIEDYRTFKSLYENDDIALSKTAYSDHIIQLASKLSQILDSIKKIFNGNKPTKCESDAKWGIDGHFNGILSDGKIRASFLSFSAGGYNIQRYHYRFKITQLKH